MFRLLFVGRCIFDDNLFLDLILLVQESVLLAG